MSLPTSMRAIKCTGLGKANIDQNVPVPSPPPKDYILVKIAAVALNPTDWKHIHNVAKENYNHSCGCDYAGTVVDPNGHPKFQVGDRVMGFIHGMKHENPSSGAFANFALAKAEIQIHVPEFMTFEEAASMPTGINTVGQSFYESMGLPWPGSTDRKGIREGEWVLIYGGSTATGMYAIKYAKLSGMKVITTCSPRNFGKLKELGADVVVDYKDGEKCAREIKEATGDDLKFAMDCVSSSSSARICADALTSKSNIAKYRALLPLEFPRQDVEHDFTLGYSAVGEPYTFFGNTITPTEGNWAFAQKWWKLAEKLIEEKKLTPVEMRIGKGGLEGVLEGLEDLRQGRVSGEKLVYSVE